MSIEQASANKIKEIDIKTIKEFSIGHAQNEMGLTGCTVILCNFKEGDDEFVSSIDVRGGLPGTRNSDAMNPNNAPACCDAIVLSGGSYFGLSAASGVEMYLEERGVGKEVRGIKIPTVVQAIIFDLAVGDSGCRPDAEMGYQACLNADMQLAWSDGNTGAGIGASVGKLVGMNRAMKGGLGTYCMQIGDLYVGAIIVVNAVGDVVDPETGEIIAGALAENKKEFINSEKMILESFHDAKIDFGNTTIGVVMTNAKISKAEAMKVSSLAQNGLARTIKPAHSMQDGDTIFTVASGDVEADLLMLQIMTVKVVERAIMKAVKAAEGKKGLIGYNDLK
jgi:L-aminopeptidase/D-esterase-like protein